MVRATQVPQLAKAFAMILRDQCHQYEEPASTFRIPIQIRRFANSPIPQFPNSKFQIPNSHSLVSRPSAAGQFSTTVSDGAGVSSVIELIRNR
jgi:hypothetical protein